MKTRKGGDPVLAGSDPAPSARALRFTGQDAPDPQWRAVLIVRWGADLSGRHRLIGFRDGLDHHLPTGAAERLASFASAHEAQHAEASALT